MQNMGLDKLLNFAFIFFIVLPTTMKVKYFAEFLGTFWLVFGGCGSAMISAAFPGLGIGLLGVSLAFGLAVLTMVYAIGAVSGVHLNPAVSIGLWAAGRLSAHQLPGYILSQLTGALLAAAVLYVIVTGNGSSIGNFAANGYNEHSPGRYSLPSALITELTLTFFFLLVILGSTRVEAPSGFAGIAIGLALTLIHLISIPVTNTSVNPARSISQAVFKGGWALEQVWLFIAAPIAGAVIAGLAHKVLIGRKR